MSARDLFERFLRDEDGDFEALLGAHPEQAEELRALHAQWFSLSGLVDSVAAPPSETAPEIEERYRVGREVGRGGMGVVFEADDERLGRRVALKVARGRRSESGDARFVAEAHVTGRIEHPGVVPVHDLGVTRDGAPYFTMQLVREGLTLEQAFERARDGAEGWSRERALDAVLRICEAVAYAHSRGVLHRDLKPANVMVGRFGEVYVMDWGLAKAGADADAGPADSDDGDALATPHTRAGTLQGTPAYMAPEQARGEPPTARVDVYAVGAILYRLLAGRAPYTPAEGSLPASEVVRRLADGPPEPLERLAPDAPAELVAIAEKGMARDATRRYADLGEMATDLRAFLEGRVVRAHRTGALVELRKWVARNRATAATAAAAVLAVVAVSTGSAVLLADKNDDLRARTEEAQRERANVLRLAALRQVDGLVAEADGLWPVDTPPGELDEWLGRAEALLAEREAFRARRDALRERARPRDAAAVEAAARVHPDAPALERERARLASLLRAVDVRDGLADVPAASLDAFALPEDPYLLRSMAWQLVADDREAFGMEARGLALARRAVERAGDDDHRPRSLRVLAHALVAVGSLDEALERIDAAVADVHATQEERATWGPELEQRAAGLEPSIAASQERVAELEARTRARRRWSFDSDEDAWLHDQLAALVARLADLEALVVADAPGHGWSVRRRLDAARELADRRRDPALRELWERTVRDVAASPRYGGLELEPAPDLHPLGPDPESGLHEFAHTLSGSLPRRVEDGSLELSEDAAIVLVLLPASESWVGSQPDDPQAPNFDPGSGPGERPPHRVRLSSYLVAKHELTQAQWLALAAHNPSNAAIGGATLTDVVTGRHPVTNVSWHDADAALRRVGLRLPTEAEWEHAARAGAQTPWSSGANASSLDGHANLADATVAEQFGAVQGWRIEPEHRDGRVIHAPVGSYAPNAFGLYDVHGNAGEWCADANDVVYYARSPVADPCNHPVGDEPRAVRGGAYSGDAVMARSAARISGDPRGGGSSQGARAARSVRVR